jgi:uncharacterized membrane protein YdbT with pleckstrin-like domain
MNEQKLIEQAQVCRLHWIIFLRPLLLLLIPLGMSYLIGFQVHIFLSFVLIAGVWFISEVFRYLFSYLIIQPRNVILQSGFFIQQTIDLPLMKIESIDIKQSLIGTVLNYGDILITGSGGSKQILHCIQNPLTCRRYIEQNLHAVHE